MFNKAILLASILLMIPAAMLSQGITTASLNGTVKTESDEPLVEANVVAIHEPSGSTFGAASRTDGRFNIPGVRVGGPYTVTASYLGYQTEKQEGIFLSLGADFEIRFVMLEQAIQFPEIVTVAERNAILTASHVGTATNVSTAEIERLPTIQRTIDDFTRLTPQVNGQSVAGKNSKFNNFQVDGAVLNDAFGLRTRPGEIVGQQPISLDAIQEFNVEVAPYDVRSGGFTGGLINAITRSGDNQFRGSGYFFGRNQDFINKEVVGLEQPFDDFDELQAGFRFSGPIVPNKAFFFVNAEITRRDEPNFAAISDPTALINFPVLESDIQRIIDISKNQYGYDPGGFDPVTEETDGIKLFARADINLSTRHRLTLRHSLVDGQRDSGLRRDSRNFTLESSQFVHESTTNSTVAQLNSTFGVNIANESRLAFTRIRQKRSSPFGAFPQVVIDAGPGNVRLGPDRSSQVNALDQDIFEMTNNLMTFRGDHTITFGTHNEFIHFDNLFIQDFFGSSDFDSIDDFAAGRPSQYRLSVSKTDNPRERAEWDLIQLGFYVQDEWKPTPKLNLTAGVRADILLLPDNPLRNDLFASQFPGFHTDEVPSGKTSWSPRFGFNYDPSGNRTTQIRGGAGIFAGTPPAVWLSNQYSNTGVDFFRINVQGDATPDFSPDPNNQPIIGDANEPQTTAIELTHPDFKMPQVFRSNLAIDQQMPFGLLGTLEFLYSENINEVLFRNILIGDFGAPVGTTPDGRPDYGGQRVSSDFTRVILMDNTSKGYQWMLTAQIQTRPNQGPLRNLFGGLSYTLMEGRDVNSGRLAVALSNWQFNETDDPNGETTARSDYVVRHRIVGNLSYGFNYGRGFATTLSLFYESRSGSPVSYLFREDYNGDGIRGNDLAFIPASPNDIADPSNYDAINTFIESDDALKAARGKIFERNSATAPWQNRLDLRVAQKIPSVRAQNLEVTLDIFNLLNLLNEDWGEIRRVRFDAVSLFNGRRNDSTKPPLSLRPGDANGDSKVTRDDIYTVDDLASRWQIQLGVRYSF